MLPLHMQTSWQAGAGVVAVQNVTVVPGPVDLNASSFSLLVGNASSGTSITAGSLISVSISLQDTFGNGAQGAGNRLSATAARATAGTNVVWSKLATSQVMMMMRRALVDTSARVLLS
jgi:hypothetical protein